MNMVIPDEGKLKWIDWMLPDDGTNQEDFEVSLYTNNYTPVAGSTLSDFNEATFTGYAAVPLLRSDFLAPYLVANVAFTDSAIIPAFACTAGSPQTCYGWYMICTSTNKVVAAQRFNTARVMGPGATEDLDPFSIGLQTLH